MDSRFAQELQTNVQSLRDAVAHLPRKQVLPIAAAESLKNALSTALGAGLVAEANRVFWKDQLVTLQAWRSIATFRLSEHIESTLLLRDHDRLLASASVCRCALEVAVVSLRLSATVCKVLRTLDSNTLRCSPCFSHTLPNDLDMALYGTRLPTMKELGSPEQKNILTYLKQLKEHPNAGDLVQNYESLCELTHPNWLGNRAFYRTDESGSLTIVAGSYDGIWEESITLLVNTVTSWSAKAALSVLLQTGHAINHARAAISAT